MTEHANPPGSSPSELPLEDWDSYDQKIEFYDKHYEVLSIGTYAVGQKFFIGNPKDRRCRFCGLAEPDTTFRTTAHAIPVFLGNDQLILNSECDTCNAFFSENIETHLDKYTRPYRLAAQIRGRRGVPSYKSNDKSARVDFKNIMIVSASKDSSFVALDEEKKTFQLNITREAYIPSAIYKALCKIAISAIERESDVLDFKPTIAWIRDANHDHQIMTPLRVAATFVPGPRPFDGVSIFLLRRKSAAALPYCIFVLALGNYMYQLIVPAMPDVAHAKTFDFRIPQFPAPFENPWPFGEIKYGTLDFTSSQYQTEDVPMSFSFQHSRETTEQSNEKPDPASSTQA